MVKSDKIYTPSQYLEAIIGKHYNLREGNDIEEIDRILGGRGYNLWDYPLNEIDHILEEDVDVVLVMCSYWNEDKHEFDYIPRWFEVLEDFKEI